ncbi:MAG: hypothetical protein R6U40_14655, partial [Desulfobacterales bacterium]
ALEWPVLLNRVPFREIKQCEPLCALTFLTKVSRWFAIMATIATCRAEKGKNPADDKIPCILEPELTDMAFRKNWARLIQKIYEVDPLKCPNCQGSMRLIAFIEDENVIKKIFPVYGIFPLARFFI